MRVQVAPQVQELVGPSALVSITERVDAGALLLGPMVKMGCVEGLDRHSPRHWQQCDRSWGGTAVLGLASLLTAGAHRQVSVEASIPGLHHTLRHLRGPGITPWAGRDARLGHLLQPVRKPTSGHARARKLQARSLAVSAWSQEVSRWDASTVAGPPEVRAGGLWQCGPRTDAPRRPQLKGMLGSWDPLGRPWATAVRSGARADDGLDMPLIKRREAGRKPPGRLCVGAGKRSAWGPRASVVGRPPRSLSPRPCTGATAEAMAAGSRAGLAPGRAGALARLFRRKQRDAEALGAEGSEVASSGGLEEGDAEWTARVVVGRSPADAERQAAGREKRLAPAAHTRAALTPARGWGTRPSTADAKLVAAIATVRKAQQGEGWLQGAWQEPSARHTHSGGRGRGAATRQPRVTEPIRSHLTRLTRQEGPLRARPPRGGGQAFVTQAPPERLSLREALLGERTAYRLDRLGNRLKSRVPLAPLLVKRTDHLEGRTSLRTRGVRVLTVMAFALRRSLQNDHAKRPGLHPENTTKMTDTPTAERSLQACADVSLTIIKPAAGEGILRRLPPLSGVQETILHCLGLGTSLYRQLEIQGIGN